MWPCITYGPEKKQQREMLSYSLVKFITHKMWTKTRPNRVSHWKWQHYFYRRILRVFKNNNNITLQLTPFLGYFSWTLSEYREWAQLIVGTFWTLTSRHRLVRGAVLVSHRLGKVTVWNNVFNLFVYHCEIIGDFHYQCWSHAPG